MYSENRTESNFCKIQRRSKVYDLIELQVKDDVDVGDQGRWSISNNHQHVQNRKTVCVPVRLHEFIF